MVSGLRSPVRPMLTKKPTSNRSFTDNRLRESSEAAGCPASNMPTTSAPRSPLTSRAENSAYPGTRAMKIPKSACISPWPNRPHRARTGLAAGTRSTSSRAQGLGGSLGGGADEDHRRDVLEDQDADGETAVERLALAALLQRLDHQDRAGEGHREGQQRQRLEVLVPEQPHPQHAEQPDEAEDQGHRCDQVDPCRQPGLAPQQDPHVDLQPDAEQQQGDAEIGQDVQGRQRVDARDVEREPGGEEADQRRKAQQTSAGAAHEDRRQVHRRQVHGARQATGRTPRVRGPRPAGIGQT